LPLSDTLATKEKLKDSEAVLSQSEL